MRRERSDPVEIKKHHLIKISQMILNPIGFNIDSMLLMKEFNL